MVIFGGPESYQDRRSQELAHRSVCATVPAAPPPQLPWSERLITFDKNDHPNHIVKTCRFPLVVNTMIKTAWVTMIFMDGGSNINLLYWDTFEKLKIGIDKLCPPWGLIYGVTLGRQVMPVGTITLKVTFGNAVHYRRETLLRGRAF